MKREIIHNALTSMLTSLSEELKIWESYLNCDGIQTREATDEEKTNVREVSELIQSICNIKGYVFEDEYKKEFFVLTGFAF